MRTALLLLAFGLSLAAAEPAEDKDVVATAQRLFDAMSAHDGDAIRALLTPDARFTSVRENGTVTTTAGEQFASRVAGMKDALLERMWNPKVLLKGRIAEVWAEYDFYAGGKFGHCGVDSFSLVKTAEGWRISGIAYTVETSGCTPSPLGPPPAGEAKL